MFDCHTAAPQPLHNILPGSQTSFSGSSSERYVKTDDIKMAVSGQEQAVLHAIGIDWHASYGHIHCPYPSHEDKNPSWRWDETNRIAHCTCMSRSGGPAAHDIFNIVTAKEGGDFNTVKLRIAEIINRHDLIHKKNGDKTGQYQKQDPASLLSPLSDNRDDNLVWNYLGHRLGIHPDQVPRPATRVVGIKQLAYFDPPAIGNGKPVCIGHYPCAVFETVGRDNSSHAHRIYLAANGLGKADLSVDVKGKPRDPKKSAKKVDNRSTAGLSVIWGDRMKAIAEVTCEGIENGAAIAYSFRAEIAAGRMIVAAAISAAGLESFCPWPASTAGIVAAADRDEGASPDGRPGSKTGEIAARKLCLRIHDQAQFVGIALPGKPGETIDWLDILRRDGVDAVRIGISNAVRFVPTEEDLAGSAVRRSRDAALVATAEMYPLPQISTPRLIYAHAADGKVKIHKIIDSGEGKKFIPVTSPFGIVARLRHANQANAYGLRCLVQDMRGEPRAVDFDRGLLQRSGGADIRAMLFSAGLRTEGDGDAIVMQVLKAADPEREIIILDRPGWNRIDGCLDQFFVAPDSAVSGVPDGVDVELAASVRMSPHAARAGTLDNWKRAIAATVSVPNVPHWVLAIAGGFAGTLVQLAGFDTCGINMSGRSTSGKSTGQRLAVSSWSTPDIRERDGLFKSALSTVNATEPAAQRATGSVFSLDELSHLDGKNTAKLIYTLGGNAGKNRLNADATPRDNYTWSTFVMLSCETSLESKVRSDGTIWRAGMAVRISDIDVSGVNREVDQATLDAIDAVNSNYGHAGIAFVRALVEQGVHQQTDKLRKQIDKAAKTLAGGDNADAAKIRAARPLALLLVAGTMAVSFDLLPKTTPIEQSIQWAWNQFENSSDAAALDPEAQMITNLTQWIAERWDVTIKSAGLTKDVNNREAIGWYDEKAVYIPRNRIEEATGNILKISEIGQVLNKYELLEHKPADDRYVVSWVPHGGRMSAFALKREKFGGGQAAKDPDEKTTLNLKVVQP